MTCSEEDLRKAKRDLIRRLQHAGDQRLDVAANWQKKWSKILPECVDSLFLIEEIARIGFLTIEERPPATAPKPAWHNAVFGVGIFGLFIVGSHMIRLHQIFLVVALAAVLVANYLDFWRDAWPRLVVFSLSTSIAVSGLSPWTVQLQGHLGEWGSHTLSFFINPDQSEPFSAFLIVTGLVGAWCSHKFMR